MSGAKKSLKYPDIESALKQVGEQIKKKRQASGYTNLDKFAIENDISRSLYWGHEKGQGMTLTSLMRIMNGLDMTLGEFFTELEKSQPEGHQTKGLP